MSRLTVKRMPQRQGGAALLAFSLLIIVGTAYLLLTEFNANYIQVKRQQQTRAALLEAKQALIGYAVVFPEVDALTPGDVIDGPGYLPCPDTNNNGSAGSPCALSSGSSIGRYPYKTLETQEFRDGNGERLWYVVSDVFRNNPKTIPLNSETARDASEELTVNGIDHIAAVIFSPGVPQTGQQRESDENDYTNYLEATFTDSNTTIVTANTDDFILLTTDELMQAVEKRVLGEVRQMLEDYIAQYNAYPWLTPFADPKAEFRNYSGIHDGGDNATSVSDGGADFVAWDIQNGDMVINITDGSAGLVSGVTATTLNVGSMTLGSDNDFDTDDEFVVVKNNWASDILAGTATSGSTNLVLEDSSKDFPALGISVGMIIDNTDDGSRGVVASIDATDTLTVKSLSGGTLNQFSSGDEYAIRSNVGQATGPVDSASLVDTDKNFVNAGIQAGDLLVNLTDGSHGRVSTVSANTLTLDTLVFGQDNDFDTNDYYYLPRYNTDNATREGLLAFHQEGNRFPTAFNMDFNITADSSDIAFDTAGFPLASSAYITTLNNYISNYVSANSLSFTSEEGICTWYVPEIADCYANIEDFVNISGRDTASVNSQTQITDSTAQFVTDGVKRGDLAHNYDDETFVTNGTADTGSTGTTLYDASADFTVYEPYNYVIQNDTLESDLSQAKIQGVISEIIDANTLVATSYVGEGTEPIEFRVGDNYSIYEPRKDMVVIDVPGNTTLTISRLTAANPDFDAGEYYRIIPAAAATSGTVDSTTPGTCTSSAVCTITDSGADFINAGVEVDDTIENSTSSPAAAFGIITAVTATSVTTRLYGGTQNFFLAGDSYIIYHDYIHSRQHEIHARFREEMLVKTQNEQRVRDICMGYQSDCTTLDTGPFTGNDGFSLLTVRDYQLNGEAVGRSTFTPSASSTGALRIAGIDYFLAENNGEIPGWFLDNRWQQLVYIAYSADYIPGGADDCVTSGNCLTLTGGGPPNNNKHAVIVISGDELTGQDRSASGLTDYFELENADPGDDDFERSSISDTFNDQIRVIE